MARGLLAHELMYAFASDDNAGVLLGIHSAADQTDADYESSIREMVRGDGEARSRGLPFVYVLFVSVDAPLPGAHWRKRFAETNHAMQSVPYCFVLVTESALMRGTFTAVQWLTGVRAGQHYVALPSLGEVRGWLAKQLGRDYPQLDALAVRARRSIAIESPRPIAS